MITHRYTSKVGALIGEDGIYSGSIMKIPTYTDFVIGRDPDECDLVISSDCKNVSRVHCSVAFDQMNNYYVIKDTSSNGTIVKTLGGEKTLIKHQTLKAHSGSVIYIGDDSNSFRLF